MGFFQRASQRMARQRAADASPGGGATRGDDAVSERGQSYAMPAYGNERWRDEDERGGDGGARAWERAGGTRDRTGDPRLGWDRGPSYGLTDYGRAERAFDRGRSQRDRDAESERGMGARYDARYDARRGGGAWSGREMGPARNDRSEWDDARRDEGRGMYGQRRDDGEGRRGAYAGGGRAEMDSAYGRWQRDAWHGPEDPPRGYGWSESGRGYDLDADRDRGEGARGERYRFYRR
jgi:hypothetical protein